jgi:hypothetical protein
MKKEMSITSYKLYSGSCQQYVHSLNTSDINEAIIKAQKIAYPEYDLDRDDLFRWRYRDDVDYFPNFLVIELFTTKERRDFSGNLIKPKLMYIYEERDQ